MLIALLLNTAFGAEVTWTFEAQATSIDSVYPASITAGDVLTGSVTFEVPTDTGGVYQDAVLAAEFTLDGQTWTELVGGSVTVTNSSFDNFSTAWTVTGPSLVGSGGQTLTPRSVNISVFDTQAVMFSSQAFPSPPPDPTLFETNEFVVRFDNVTEGGTPEALFEITDWQEITGPDSCPASPKLTPEFCGCSYEDIDVTGGTACVHFDATVSPSATLGPEVQVDAYATVGASTLRARTRVANRATIGDNSLIGADSIIGRRASIGDNVQLGSGATISRAATVVDDTIAGISFTMGYGSTIGRAADVGDRVTLGSLVQAQGLLAGNDIVIARGAVLSGIVTLDDNVVIGPEVTIGDGTVIGDRVRIRKDVQIGERVTIGRLARIGRDTVMGNDSGVGDSGVLRGGVNLGTFSNLPASFFAPRRSQYPANYDRDGDGALSIDMGGNDCDDTDPLSIEVCIDRLVTTNGAREWRSGAYAASCDGYRNPGPGAAYDGDIGSGQYNIDPDGDGTPFVAYCDMSTTIGWTLAANIAAGSSSNWTYDSTWWTSSGSAQYSDPGPTQGEARYEVFDESPYTAIRLVDPASGREVHITDGSSSLVNRFATTSTPTLSPASLGGYGRIGRATVSHTRYDAGAFGFLANLNARGLCSDFAATDVTGWTSSRGLAINDAGRYNASGGNYTSGRTRIGAWLSGSYSHVWDWTTDCSFGVGATTARNGSEIHTGTTMGTLTTLWVR